MKSFHTFLESVEPDAITKLRAGLHVPTGYDNTWFLLPDGTRLDVGGMNNHRRAVEYLGTTMEAVLAAGVVRYNGADGLEVGAAINILQSRIIHDDFIRAHSFFVDVNCPNGKRSSRSFDYDRWSANVLHTFINNAVK